MPADRSVTNILDLSDDLRETSAILAAALGGVASAFDRALRSDLPPVSRLTRHVERYRGKMVRPTLTILSALASAPPPPKGEVPESSRAEGANHPPRQSGIAFPGDADQPPTSIITPDLLRAAAVCEMVHMATLVHDDILDEAETRRRGHTVNALHGNEAAVMLGDLLLASAYELCSSLPGQEASLLIARASVVMCGGELLQLHHRGDWSLDEPTYFEIVSRKTGELIAASASLGAWVAGASPAHRAALTAFARDVGIAFQIQDDLLDLEGDEHVVGKTLGRDLQKGKLTLPVIHHLATADANLRGRTLLVLESARRLDAEHEQTNSGQALLGGLRRTDSLAYAQSAARELIQRAKQHLHPLPSTPARAILERLADAVTARTY